MAGDITAGVFAIERIPALGMDRITGLSVALSSKQDSSSFSTFVSKFDSMFEVVNGKIKAKLDFYSVGGISAYGEGITGGGAGFDETTLATYLTTNKYTTEIWVIAQGYLKSLPAHTHGWSSITGIPNTFTPEAHSHDWGEITSKPDSFIPSAHAHPWADITGKPTTFSPATHSHPISNITSLQSSLDNLTNKFGNYLPLSGGKINSGTYIGLNGGTVYGIGVVASNRNSACFDTIEANGSDWLELCYYAGSGIRIGTGTNGTKPLYASALYQAGALCATQTWVQNTAKAAHVGLTNYYEGFGGAYRSSATSSSGILIKLPYGVTAGKMVCFTVRLYKSYQAYDIQFSGYLYNDNGGYWYSPKAQMIAGTTSVPVKMGFDASKNAYVWIGNSSDYAGVAILNIVSGYSASEWSTGWVISASAGSEIATINLDTTLYPITSYLLKAGGDMTSGARISASGGNLYVGNANNAGWLGVQDMCSQSSLGDGIWSIRTNGNAIFKTVTATTFTGDLSGTFNGLALNGTTNNAANCVVRTDGNGYANFGWINTASGTASGTLTRVYCSQDAYLRYLSPANFISGLALATTAWVSANFNKYVHPTGAGNNHVPTSGASGQWLKWSATGVAAWVTPAVLTRGSYITGANYNGNTATTWAVDATPANSASKVVARDASGNFSAGTITAALSGNASTATTASNLTYFKCTSSVNIGIDTTDSNAIGYVSGISLLGQSDGGLFKQVYSAAWMGEVYIDYRTGQLCSRGKNNGTLQAWRTQVDSGNYTNYAISKAVDSTITAKIIVGGSNRDGGMYGTYDSTKTQSIWSMGTSYKNAADGSNFGSLYGLAYKHTNNATGGTMAGGHQVVWCQNGTPCCALGNGIWTSGSVTGTTGVFSGRVTAGGVTLGYNNTSYALSTSSLICQSWIRTTGSTGWYSETYAGGVHMTDSTWVRIYNSKKFYVPSTAVDSIRTDGGFVREAYAGTSWNAGQGALGVAIVNNSAQTPLLVAYRSGQAANVTGVNRLFAIELLNTGATLQVAFGGAAKYTFSSSGNFTATGEVTAYTTSDARLKENIRPLNGLATLRLLKFKEFDWNDKARKLTGDNRKHGAGLIAQEVKNVLPDAVGNIYNSKYLGVCYEKLIPYLGAAVMQHDSEITRLKNRVKELEVEVKRLKTA